MGRGFESLSRNDMKKQFDIYAGSTFRDIKRYINENEIKKEDIVAITPYQGQIMLTYYSTYE